MINEETRDPSRAARGIVHIGCAARPVPPCCEASVTTEPYDGIVRLCRFFVSDDVAGSLRITRITMKGKPIPGFQGTILAGAFSVARGGGLIDFEPMHRNWIVEVTFENPTGATLWVACHFEGYDLERMAGRRAL